MKRKFHQEALSEEDNKKICKNYRTNVARCLTAAKKSRLTKRIGKQMYVYPTKHVLKQQLEHYQEVQVR